MTFSRKINHSYIYVFGLALLIIGLPFSNFLMSVSQFLLIGNWLLEGDLKNKLQRFRNNQAVLAISSVFIIHLLGLLYSNDFNYGLEDIRKKVPLLLLPLIISSSKPLPPSWFKKLLGVFVLAVFIGTLISCFVLVGFIGEQIIDVRQISLFISHIRFSLMICLSFFLVIYFAFSNKGIIRIISLLLALWFVLFLGLMESLTGLVVLGIISFILITYQSFMLKKREWKIVCISLLLLLPVSSFIYISYQVKEFYHINPVDLTNLEKFSSRGNYYVHDLESKEVENGNYLKIYIAFEELQEAWNKRSEIPFKGLDKKEQLIEGTIIRFLTSRGLRKDAAGVEALTEEEVQSIERGIANVRYQEVSSLPDRIRQVIWEIDRYAKGENINGHSLTMRLEFWRTAIGIIKSNPFFGVGTGDVRTAFDDQYNLINSPLSPQWRLRAHNQFLEITVALGLVGLVVFLFSLIFPFYTNWKNIDYFYVVFFIISIFSMLSEDTLETQAGITFFAFFNCFFLFGREDSSNQMD